MSNIEDIKFIGLDTQYPTANGQPQQRLHMDGAASPLAAQTAVQTIHKLLPHYSNSHSYVHSSAHISTQALAWAHDTVLSVLGANKEDYTAIFTGSGTTAGINRVARGLAGAQGLADAQGLAGARAGRNVVFVSSMEHHANDLPHRQFTNDVVYLPLNGEGKHQGTVDLMALETLCQQYQDKLNYVAVSWVSNVSGIQNPIAQIAEIAHCYGGLLLVDGAQSVAHQKTALSRAEKEQEIDFFVFSGHKVYSPMSPGVLVAKKAVLDTLSGQDLGGGSVDHVSRFDYQLSNHYPDKEQSGTPNIVGAVALANVMSELDELGFETIEQHASRLMGELISELKKIAQITLYGSPDLKRIGALSFNHTQIDHGLLAAILNDYYAIAVRNECFCAHPYVSSMLKEELWDLDLSDIAEDEQESFINRKRGMVRVSLSLYNTLDDIKRLINALLDIEQNIEQYRPYYQANDDGSYQHMSFTLDWQNELGL